MTVKNDAKTRRFFDEFAGLKQAEVAGRSPETGERSGTKRPKPAKSAQAEARTVAFLEPEEAPAVTTTKDAGVSTKKSAGRSGKTAAEATTPKKTAKAKAGRAKARKPNEKLTPASIYKKMITFGKIYQIENEQDFQEAARIYAEEAGLIDQMRDQIAEEGLTVIKSYKTGDVPVAHPLLSELPRHVESANKCLSTIGAMITDRGAKKERAARDLDKFRLH